jgi:CheY-like chemotaxis protein
MSQILVVDDEVGIRELLSEILRDEGHQVRLAQNAGADPLWRSEPRLGIGEYAILAERRTGSTPWMLDTMPFMCGE